jgi:hypothetical protein
MPGKRKKRLTGKQAALAKQRREWQKELDDARRQQRIAKAKRQEQSGPLPGAPAGRPKPREFRKEGGRTRIVSGGAFESNRRRH